MGLPLLPAAFMLIVLSCEDVVLSLSSKDIYMLMSLSLTETGNCSGETWSEAWILSSAHSGHHKEQMLLCGLQDQDTLLLCSTANSYAVTLPPLPDGFPASA